MKFGEKLKALRTDKGISQKALSDQTGISLRAIQNYETKDILPKSRDSYDALARALDVEVSTLLVSVTALVENGRPGRFLTRLGPCMLAVSFRRRIWMPSTGHSKRHIGMPRL